jgi:hypothetical protein
MEAGVPCPGVGFRVYNPLHLLYFWNNETYPLTKPISSVESSGIQNDARKESHLDGP